jgi:hypothetical protein
MLKKPSVERDLAVGDDDLIFLPGMRQEGVIARRVEDQLPTQEI